MKILAIETSCDETAVCLLEATEDGNFTVLGNALLSQIDIHREFGGVYPNMAKREHAKNLVPLLETVLRDAKMLIPAERPALAQKDVGVLKNLLEREPELFSRLVIFLAQNEKPQIDRIAVTSGPGLEPALWVGINLAKALSRAWNIPITPVNHMEGHIFSSILEARSEVEFSLPKLSFPALSLLISGGHTELVKMDDWGSYELIGETRDDAVGEAFDKAARMMELPYPGGPEIARLADQARAENLPPIEQLPRPMLDSGDLDFSFSGLKTAVLYALKQQDTITDEYKKQMAREFEDAASDVLIEKTKKALVDTGAQTLIIGGGVSANTTIRDRFEALMHEFKGVQLYIPNPSLTTDNAIMIAIAGYMNRANTKNPDDIVAEGHCRL